MKVDWIRHNETVPLYLPPSWAKRPFLYPTPVLRQDISRYLDYRCRQDLGLSLVLMHRNFFPLYYPEALSKRACWLVKHLCERTDLMEQGVCLRLTITTDIRDVVMPYLEACNFPMHVVNWVESRESQYSVSTKLIAMQQPTFQFVDRVIHMDLAYLIGTHDSQHKTHCFQSILDCWEDQPFAMSHPLIMSPEEQERFGESVIQRYGGVWKTPERNLFWQVLSEYCKEPVSDLKAYFLNDPQACRVSGGLFGFSRMVLDTMDLDTDIFPIMRVGPDEAAVTAYTYKQRWQNEQCAVPKLNWGEICHPVPTNTEYTFCFSTERSDTDIWLSQHQD